MVEKIPIIALASNSWDGPWMNRQQLLSRLAARGWPVIYSNEPPSLWDRETVRWNKLPLIERSETDSEATIYTPGKLFASWPRSKLWMRQARKWHARRLRQLSNIGSDNRGIAFAFQPMFSDYVTYLGLKYVVYHAYDLLSETADWNPELEKAEKTLIESADIVSSPTQSVSDVLERRNNKPMRVLPNGADAAAFEAGSAQACPTDLEQIPHPRISYVGRMTPSVDFSLVADIAAARPEWNWVMVGPVLLEGAGKPEAERIAKSGLKRCRTLANIHFLGCKEHTELPSYMAHMDINTLCYRSEGGWWQFGYPLKMHEYLAVGKPVLGADLRAVREFEGVIDIATTTQEWIEAIERTLDDRAISNSDERKSVAHQNTWDQRVDQLEGWLFDLIEGRLQR